jgi:ABC-type transporter Mla MlaB component
LGFSVDSLPKKVENFLEHGESDFILNLTGVGRLDSSGIGLLVIHSFEISKCKYSTRQYASAEARRKTLDLAFQFSKQSACEPLGTCSKPWQYACLVARAGIKQRWLRNQNKWPLGDSSLRHCGFGGGNLLQASSYMHGG